MSRDHALRRTPKLTGHARRAGPALAVLVLAGCAGGSTVNPSTPSRGAAVATPSVAENGALLSVLREGWSGYAQAFIAPGGRVVDPTRGGTTTSEGQSYALLRAAWMGDRTTFDSVWQWTAGNLQVRGDGLLASRWGNGAVEDHNSASDADSDTALALLFAARHFGADSYRAAALTVLAGMWQHDVVSIGGMNVLTAGNWASVQQSPGPVLNPSYFAPYAYRVFAREDPSHPWSSLVDSSYVLLGRCSAAGLGGRPSAGLPPNWCAVDSATGAVVSFPQIAAADDYGYDAFRVMWRVALDAQWNGEQRARDFLTRAAFLRQRWAAGERLDPVYGHDGTVLSGYDDPTVYGGDIGSFVFDDPAAAARIRDHMLAAFHSGPPAYFGDPRNYFEQNWVWFGLALAGSLLPNLDGASQ